MKEQAIKNYDLENEYDFLDDETLIEMKMVCSFYAHEKKADSDVSFDGNDDWKTRKSQMFKFLEYTYSLEDINDYCKELIMYLSDEKYLTDAERCIIGEYDEIEELLCNLFILSNRIVLEISEGVRRGLTEQLDNVCKCIDQLVTIGWSIRYKYNLLSYSYNTEQLELIYIIIIALERFWAIREIIQKNKHSNISKEISENIEISDIEENLNYIEEFLIKVFKFVSNELKRRLFTKIKIIASIEEKIIDLYKIVSETDENTWGKKALQSFNEELKGDYDKLNNNDIDYKKIYKIANRDLGLASHCIMMCTIGNRHFGDKVRPILKGIDKAMKDEQIKTWKKETSKRCFALMEVDFSRGKKGLYFVISSLKDNKKICDRLGIRYKELANEIEKSTILQGLKYKGKSAELIRSNDRIHSYMFKKVKGKKYVVLENALAEFDSTPQRHKEEMKNSISYNFACCERKFFAHILNHKGLSVKRVTMYIKYEPCDDCLQEIFNNRRKIQINERHMWTDKARKIER